MGIFAKIMGSNTAPAAPPATEKALTVFPGAHGLGLDGKAFTTFGIGLDELLSEPTFARCFNLLGDALAGITPYVVECQPGGGCRPAVHPLNAVLANPYPSLSRFEWAELQVRRMLMDGRAQCFVVRDGRYRALELIPILPATRFVSDVDGSIWWGIESSLADQIVGPRLRAKGAKPLVSDLDILTLRGPAGLRTHGQEGYSLARMATPAVALARDLAAFAGSMARNGARPGGVLKTAGKLSAEAQARLKKAWESSFAGVGNASKTAVLEEGLEWQNLSVNPVDAEVTTHRRLQTEEIARVMGVPLSLLGMAGQMSRASAESEIQAWAAQTLRPMTERWEAALEKTLLFPYERERGLGIEFDLSEMLRADFAARTSGYTALRTAGIASPNEIRSWEGLPPVSGGDDIAAPLNSNRTDAPGRPADPATMPGGKSLEARLDEQAEIQKRFAGELLNQRRILVDAQKARLDFEDRVDQLADVTKALAVTMAVEVPE